MKLDIVLPHGTADNALHIGEYYIRQCRHDQRWHVTGDVGEPLNRTDYGTLSEALAAVIGAQNQDS